MVLSCHNITATSLYNVITTLPTDVCETLISEVQTTPIKRIPGPCDNVVGTSLCFLVKHFGIFSEIKLVFDLPQIASGYFNFVHKTTLLKIPYNVKRERQDRSFDYLISQESRPFLVLKKIRTYIVAYAIYCYIKCYVNVFARIWNSYLSRCSHLCAITRPSMNMFNIVRRQSGIGDLLLVMC